MRFNVPAWGHKTTVSGGAPCRHGLGNLAPQKSLSPRRKTYWSRIRRWTVRNFQILIVSAVKNCKQCLQTDSASGTASPWCPTRSSPLGPTGWLLSPDPVGNAPNENFQSRQWRQHRKRKTDKTCRNLNEVIWKLFQRLIAAHDYFPTCSISLK